MAIAELIEYLTEQQVVPTEEINGRLEASGSAPLRTQATLAQLLRRPEICMEQLRAFRPDIPKQRQDVDAQAEVQLKYQGYVDRQLEMVQRFQRMEHAKLPPNLDYSEISGLSREVCEKLNRIKPQSLGQASRIPGVTPAAISLLSFHIKKKTA